jgi:hypothetical protein
MVQRTLQALARCYKQRAFGGFVDQSRHRLRLRDIDRVAAFDLDDRRTSTVSNAIALPNKTEGFESR